LSADEQRALEAAFGEGVREIHEDGKRLFVIPN